MIDDSARRASLQVLYMEFFSVDGLKSFAALIAESVFSCLILNADGSILSAKKKLVQDDDPT